MRNFIAVPLCAITVLIWASVASASSPWLDEPGHLEASTGYVYEGFDKFYRGTKSTDFPRKQFDQHTAMIALDYVVRDGVAVDMALGYVGASVGKNAAGGKLKRSDGIQDFSFGIRFQVLDEFESDSSWTPTVSFRFGGILGGTYDAEGSQFPGIPNDGASGFEGEFAFGKLGLPWDIGLTGNLGVRARNKGVPIEWHLRAGIFRTFIDAVTVSLAYDQWRATSGLDIGGAGFTPDAFRELKEVSKNVETGIGYSDKAGRYFGFYYIRTVGGRNTGIRDSYGLTFSAPITGLGG